MEPWQIVWVAALVLIGVALNSAVGFGIGLFAIPVMVWAGVELPAAITITLIVVAFQSAWNCYEYRSHICWRQTMPLSVCRLLTIPVGVLLLVALADVGQDRAKQVIGGVLLTVLAVQWALKIPPQPRVAAGWTVLAGTTSGLLDGMLGMGGPPIVLWVTAHDWPSKRARAFLWASRLPLLPVNLAILWLKFGDLIPTAMLIGLACMPLTLLGSMVGMKLGAMLSRGRLRAAVLAMLAAIALSSIVGPMI